MVCLGSACYICERPWPLLLLSQSLLGAHPVTACETGPRIRTSFPRGTNRARRCGCRLQLCFAVASATTALVVLGCDFVRRVCLAPACVGECSLSFSISGSGSPFLSLARSLSLTLSLSHSLARALSLARVHAYSLILLALSLPPSLPHSLSFSLAC